jgi:hypothetical protein
MPRRSDGNLPKLVILSGRERPAPPEKLTADERKIWDRLVASAPGGYFDQAAGAILVQAVTLIADAERLKALRAEYIAQGNIEAELALGKTIRDNAKATGAHGVAGFLACGVGGTAVGPETRDGGRSRDRGVSRKLAMIAVISSGHCGRGPRLPHEVLHDARGPSGRTSARA